METFPTELIVPLNNKSSDLLLPTDELVQERMLMRSRHFVQKSEKQKCVTANGQARAHDFFPPDYNTQLAPSHYFGESEKPPTAESSKSKIVSFKLLEDDMDEGLGLVTDQQIVEDC